MSSLKAVAGKKIKLFGVGVILIFSAIILSATTTHAQPYPDAPAWHVNTSWTSTHNYPLFVVAAERYMRNSDGSWKARGASGALPAKPRTESTSYGTDVTTFAQGTSAAYLYALLPNGNVTRIFPLPQHQSLIDRPLGIGAVTEPTMSENGDWIYFSYFHDVTIFRNQFNNSMHGADIYRVRVRPLIDNPLTDPNTLVAQRVTFQPGPAANLAAQTRFAINPTVSTNSNNGFNATVNISPVEMRTESGLKLVYSSNKRRVTNASAGKSDEQMTLFTADVGANGAISNDNQFQYYTTSSWISSFNTRNGIGGTYGTGIDSFARKWETQLQEPNGKWYPGSGYGRTSSSAFHNSTMCATNANDTTGVDDYIVDTAYYGGAGNNNGFGGLVGTGMRAFVLGEPLNIKYAPGNRRISTQRYQVNLNLEVDTDQDSPSRGSVGNWVGKFTTPRCGEARELYVAYTPSCAHHRYSTACIENVEAQNLYRSAIVLRLLEQGSPTAWHPLTSGAQTMVLDDTADFYSLLWPTPAIPLFKALPGPKRFAGTPNPGLEMAHQGGLVTSVIGSSDLQTDIVAPDCRLPNRKFKPTMNENLNSNGDSLTAHMAFLSKVRDRNNMNLTCDEGATNILGVAILETDNKIDKTRYATQNRHELTKLLGVIDVRNNPPGDTSFRAAIPANIPFKLELLDAETGYKLTDQRSWHTLKPREERTDCGGCHEHTKPGIPTTGKHAFNPSYQVADLIRTTPYVDYNAHCQPFIAVENAPSKAMDIWGDNRYLFQKFNQYCSDCHQAGGSGVNAFAISDAATTLQTLKQKFYVYPLGGANSSPAAWAVHGRRLDGRDNSDPFYAPDFVFSAIHANPAAHEFTARCQKGDLEYAQWAYRFGRWIDNHMPNDTSFPQNSAATWTNTMPAEFDRFHPTVNGALKSGRPNCSPAGGLIVDAWDDTGHLASVKAEYFDGFADTRNNLNNGTIEFPLERLANGTDWVKITATDAAGNRQTYEKNRAQLIFECQIAGDPLSGSQGGGNNPGPPGGTQVGLRISPTAPMPGDEVTFCGDTSPGLAGNSMLFVGSRGALTSQGFEANFINGSVRLAFPWDDFSTRSVGALSCTINAQGTCCATAQVNSLLTNEALQSKFQAVALNVYRNYAFGPSAEVTIVQSPLHWPSEEEIRLARESIEALRAKKKKLRLRKKAAIAQDDIVRGRKLKRKIKRIRRDIDGRSATVGLLEAELVRREQYLSEPMFTFEK